MRKPKNIIAVLCAICLMFVAGYTASKIVIKDVNAANTEPPTHHIHALSEMVKDPILANAMHTNDNYKTLYARAVKKGVKNDEVAEVWIAQGNSAKYQVRYNYNASDPDAIIEAINRGDKVKQIDKKHSREEITTSMPEMKKPEKLEPNTIYPNWNGSFTGVNIVDILIHPESDIQSLFLRSKVSSDGVVEVLGRKATKFTVDPQYKKDKVDTGKYEYYFDNETGILLKIVAYDGSNIKEETYFETIQLNGQIDDAKFKF